MKRNSDHSPFFTLAALAASVIFFSCKNDFESLPQGSVIRADVVTFDSSSLSQPSDVPKFRYGPQSFRQMTDLDRLSGPRFKVLQGGDLEIQETVGSVITSSEFNGYTLPTIDYRVVDGVVKPLNSKSLSMLSASYQFDSLIDKIEALTGLAASVFFKGDEQFSILYHPSVELSSASEQTRKYETSNAAYVAGAKQFALFFLGTDERVPMNFNPQILSHEFGHAIFEKSFFNGKYERCAAGDRARGKLFPGRLESEFTVRGINEGFADFVSFVWTGSSNILQSSLGEIIATRERDFAKLGFDYDTYTTKESEVCRGRFYCVGTLWAKTLYDVFSGRSLDAKNVEVRQQFLREVVNLMEKVGAALRENNGTRLPEPDQRTTSCQSRDFVFPTPDGDMLASFFSTLIEKTEPASRALYCSAIAKNFGTSGFPVTARRNCP